MCKDKSFSIQIVAQGPNRNQIQIPVFGKHKCALVSAWFYSPEGIAQPFHLIRLNSPQFRLKHSSAVAYFPSGILRSELSAQPFPVFTTQYDAQVSGLNGSVEWETDFQGTVELELESLMWDGVLDDDVCIFTLRMTPIE